MAVSAVSSADPSPTIDFVIPDTVPVNVGLASGAYVEAAVADANLAARSVVKLAIFD